MTNVSGTLTKVHEGKQYRSWWPIIFCFFNCRG